MLQEFSVATLMLLQTTAQLGNVDSLTLLTKAIIHKLRHEILSPLTPSPIDTAFATLATQQNFKTRAQTQASSPKPPKPTLIK